MLFGSFKALCSSAEGPATAAATTSVGTRASKQGAEGEEQEEQTAAAVTAVPDRERDETDEVPGDDTTSRWALRCQSLFVDLEYSFTFESEFEGGEGQPLFSLYG